MLSSHIEVVVSPVAQSCANIAQERRLFEKQFLGATWANVILPLKAETS